MKTKNVDLLIIGAGATGSSIAYEATRRGLNVALLDSGDKVFCHVGYNDDDEKKRISGLVAGLPIPIRSLEKF